MLIRFEISDKEGKEFKDKTHSNNTTMSKLIRQWIKKYIKEEK